MSPASPPSPIPDATAKAIGVRLAAARKRAGLNQSELARRARVSRQYVCRVERGLRVPSVGTLTTLAEVLGTDAVALLGAPVPSEERSDTIGSRLRSERLRLSMTVIDVAEASGITHGYISHIETGKRQPTIQTLTSICKAIGADAAYVLTGCAERSGQPDYGSRIREALERSGMSAAELARSIEAGESYGRPGSIAKLAAAFEVSIESLYDRHPSLPIHTWTVTPERWGERHTQAELGLVVDTMRDPSGRVVDVYTRIDQPTGSMPLDRAIAATAALAERVRSLRPQTQTEAP